MRVFGYRKRPFLRFCLCCLPAPFLALLIIFDSAGLNSPAVVSVFATMAGLTFFLSICLTVLMGRQARRDKRRSAVAARSGSGGFAGGVGRAIYQGRKKNESHEPHPPSTPQYSRPVPAPGTFSGSSTGHQSSSPGLGFPNLNHERQAGPGLHERERIVRERLEKLGRMFKASRKLKLDDVAGLLDMGRKELLDFLFNWAEKLEFKIDGDYIVVEREDFNMFIDSLDEQFDKWGDVEREKRGKL